MSTSLDTCTDPQGAALATLIQGAVNYDLRNDPRFKVTDDAIDTVYGHPRPMELIAQMSLPALNIYRFTETNQAITFHKRYYTVDFRFDYFTKAVKRETIGARWPLLRAVWRRLADVVIEGSHDEVYDGDTVLQVAGFREYDDNFTRVQYSFAPDTDGNVYPFFRGQMRLMHVEVEQSENLQLFLSMAADYILDGLEDEEQPFIESLTYTPTGQEAKDAEDNPQDCDFQGENI